MTDRDMSEADIFAAAGEPARDERGRFAQQEQDQQEGQREMRPASEERPTANLGQLPDHGRPEAPDEAQGAEGEQPRQQPEQRPPQLVPLSELQSERKKRQGYESDLAARDREMAEMRGQMAAMRQMFERMGQQPQPQQQKAPAPPPDPFEDPQGFAAHQAHEVFRQQFQPFADQSRQQQAQFQTVVNNLNRGMAEVQQGADAVKAAEEAFNTAAARGLIDPLEHRRINSSPNPYAAAVDWHKRSQSYERIGGDPDKWFSSEFERRAKEDPAFQQQMFALLNGQAQQGQQQPPAGGQNGAPAGRQAPVFTGLPPSVNGASGASARGAPPMSEDQIFLSAPTRMGGRA